MTTHITANTKVAMAAVITGLLCANAGWAQSFPVTPGQKATAAQVAQAGVPLSELAPDAPDQYTVKSGDTLWAISGLFLKSPWRWPELWGMNLAEIQNPHRIYPGQQLFLEKKDGRARLVAARSVGEAPTLNTVRVSPRTRYESLADSALPTLKTHLIEPFLAEPLILNESGLSAAPRIVAAQEGRVMLSRGDRAYARGPASQPLLDDGRAQKSFRVFRNALALRDPVTGEILGYEAQYVGKARLVHAESAPGAGAGPGGPAADIVPATIDIIASKEEMRVGDRLVAEDARPLVSYVPHAPAGAVDGRIVSIHGSAVVNAGQNQVVVINRGSKDGMDSGMVLAILRDGPRLVDSTDASRAEMKLPNERSGLLMVFQTFEKLSYALVLSATNSVRVGDRLASPR